MFAESIDTICERLYEIDIPSVRTRPGAVRPTPVRRRHVDPARTLANTVGLAPTVFFGGHHVQGHRRIGVREDHSERASDSRREACRCGGDLRKRSRPAQWAEVDWLRCMGTSRWRAKRDVPRPAVLRERGTPELGAVATHEWGAQRARRDADVHPRRVCSPRGSLLTVRSVIARRRAVMPAAWGPSSN